MIRIFETLAEELAAHRGAMLVTIVAEEGSAPRGAGAQMLVGAAGQLAGTIGGGAVEKVSESAAMELLAEGRSALRPFRLRQNGGQDIGMVCGGDVTVLFQYIPGGSQVWQDLTARLLDCLRSRRPGWLLLRTDGGAPALLDGDGAALAGDAPADTAPLQGRSARLAGELFSLPLPVGERVFLFGGGHCALPLVPLLRSVGFRVTVMDCRPEFADRSRFPDAERVICGDYRRLEDCLDLTPEDYAVVMTNGHSHDLEVEEQLLRRPLVYLGVMGSRTKTAAVNQKLRERGIPEEALRRVHAPIGTAIKAVTPEEIAVSIAGEMICARALDREAHGGPIVHGCPMK
ncbi:XdhC family protein [Dysosmobacter sp.]|uniref:XdhC family protein n=1 Tax=Dysosmobacter sp. TaxID=2591382 RepID=UPI002A8A37F4|nr:XdhC family protein [Dysosmobacter sp.]MDY3282730.1 XdhC family protein [Dysosmobacter sp.]